MDDDGFHNWGYYEPMATTFEHSVDLPLMSTVDNNTEPFLLGREPNLMIGSNSSYHMQNQETSIPMDYSWINNMVPPKNNNVMSETAALDLKQFETAFDSSWFEENLVPPLLEDEIIQPNEKRKMESGTATITTTKTTMLQNPKKERDVTNVQHQQQRVKSVKKSIDVVINGEIMDISVLPVPVCTCTGSPQQCYRWGPGGWQSACCTTNISIYPLPMSIKRRARIAGRKMSQGAFKKVLEKLASDGYNFRNAIDLKSHWARHGTNKFVTIR
uniref:GAGA-binding transcriptional activator n=1 Tax=Schrenkiella parvula TaxID=98039 RepID=E5F6Z9_9BRAS|nr:BPC1 [Schrenkiella parvula]